MHRKKTGGTAISDSLITARGMGGKRGGGKERDHCHAPCAVEVLKGKEKGGEVHHQVQGGKRRERGITE